MVLDDRVVTKEVRREKHPGEDDVHMLRLHGGRQLHVDAPIYAAIKEGQILKKAAWSRELQHDGQTLPLEWSRDFGGMAWAMPIILLIMFATAGYVHVAGGNSEGGNCQR